MEAFKFLFVILVIFIDKGFSLSCYKCEAGSLEGCKKGSPNLLPTACLENPTRLQFCILKLVYDKHFLNESVVAQCESFPKPVGVIGDKLITAPENMIVLDRNILQCQSTARFEVKQCDVCKSELCNFVSTAHATTMNLFLIFSVTILSFF